MIRIRRAGAADVDTLTRLRIDFLRETKQAPDELVPALTEATRDYFSRALPAQEFVAFVAEDESAQIVATSGLIFFDRPPSARDLCGRDGYVLNMYTCPAWRGQGIATRLLAEIVALARELDLKRLLLHAIPPKRKMYECAGFVDRANEMQLRL